MQLGRVFETVLYAGDLVAAERFYSDVLGLERLNRTELMLVLRYGPQGVLLIFDPKQSSVPGRAVPSHGTSGAGHVAFLTEPTSLAGWRRRLLDRGVEIEQEVEWESGGLSIYFRDPAGNSVELAPPTLWGGGWQL